MLAMGRDGRSSIVSQGPAVATNQRRDLRKDAGEFLDVGTATLAELLQWSREGLLTDAKTLTGLLWLQNVLSGAWSLDWKPAA